MYRFFKKYKLQFDILYVLIFGFIAADKFFFRQETEKKTFIWLLA